MRDDALKHEGGRWFNIEPYGTATVVLFATSGAEDVATSFVQGAIDPDVLLVQSNPGQNGRDVSSIMSKASAVVFACHSDEQIGKDLRSLIGLNAFVGPQSQVLLVTGDTDKAKFAKLEQDFRQLTDGFSKNRSVVIPVESNGQRPEWYDGPALASSLVARDRSGEPLRGIVRSGGDGGSWHCEIVSGDVDAGDEVKILPGAKQMTVRTADALSKSEFGLQFSDEEGVCAGAVVCAAKDPVAVSDQFEANVVWFGTEPMLPGRHYIMQFAVGCVDGNLANPKHVINPETLDQLAAKTLETGDLGVCNLSLSEEIPFAPFRECRPLGGFVVVDKFSDEIVGAGSINFALRRASNIHWQALDLSKAARSGKLGQKSSVLWFTGLSGSGKSTIANLVEKKLFALGHQTYLLDGDNVRHGLNRDLGFTDADRVENIRRVAEVARLMADAGLIVLVSFISPFRSERRMAREMLEDGEFIEVFVDTPLDVCEQRDVKGLYAKARRGEIKNFTGIDSDYETPELAEVVLDTTALDAADSADEIIDFLEAGGRLKP